MNEAQLQEFLDQQRWLLNNGLVPDSAKNQLFFFGSIVHPDVEGIEVKIRPEDRFVDYTVYVGKPLLAKIAAYKKLSIATSVFGMWRFKRFLKKEGSLDFHGMLNSFVRDFCGPRWNAKVTILDSDVYVDSIGVEGEPDGPSQPADKLPD